ncbi:MAG: flotillin-like protein FloA [Verrucomicrobia bacterium]|nr:flotillin-like protein FloA [Verrucomicrobiota bacterium]
MENSFTFFAQGIFDTGVSGWTLMFFGLIAVVGLVIAIVVINFFSVWIRALFSGARVSFTELIALRLRNVPVGMIVDNRITAVKAGLDVTIDDLSTHFLAGGNPKMVVDALIAARKASIHLVFDRACAIDLATKGTGKTVLEAVQTSVNPKVIDCPNPSSGKTSIDGVAKDGIVIKAKARVTVRTNLDRFVGGATEETIIARVGEGIVSTIGSSDTFKVVLENPDRISKTVLDKALDSNTAFEILSIDIADVDVGENVGAKLQAEQAEANKLIAQAQAEVRRAAAVALEQEMLARVQEMRARVVEAEAQVPLAMSEAFRQGNLGIMDYYRMKNVQADTNMRDSIAGGGSSPTPGKPPGS